MKILINGKDTADLSSCCRWSVIDGKLYNENTHRFEGVDGDIISYTTEKGEVFAGTVVGYTCYQFVDTKEQGSMVLSVKEALSVEIEHRSTVEVIEDDEPTEKEPVESSSNNAENTKNDMNRFQRLMNKIGADKVLHFETCCLIFLVVAMICMNRFGLCMNTSGAISIVVTLAIGVLKEVYDYKTYGLFDWNDIKADSLGILAGVLTIYYLA